MEVTKTTAAQRRRKVAQERELKLTEVERIAYLGLLARQREIEPVQQQLNHDAMVIQGGIADRLGIDIAELGTRYLINADTGEVVERSDPALNGKAPE